METPIESTPAIEPSPATSPTAAHEPAAEPDRGAAPAPPAEIAATNLLELIAAAEERGYRRGIDEAGRKAVMSSNGLWSAPAAPAQEMSYDTGAEILRTVRPGVWDL